MTRTLKKEDIEKHKLNNEKLAKSRIKLGLILNAYAEKNKLQINDTDIQSEIQKQIKGMPGQEKMVMEYYKKNPSAVQGLRSALYEDKIITLIKSKIKLSTKNVSSKEAEKIISEFNKPQSSKEELKKANTSAKSKAKTKK